jgi:hypothetical protein
MLGIILKLFRPSYALTALILFGGWQGYSFVKSTSEQLHSRADSEQVQAYDSQSDQPDPSAYVAAIQQIHPVWRIVYWLVIYLLFCFTGVPLIKRALARESNLANTILLIIYCCLGLLIAVVFTAFNFTLITAIMLVLALVFSASMIIWLASELEKIRLEDAFSFS